jgi:hypothetical protein
VRDDCKVRGGQLIPGKGLEWMGIRHHKQDVGLESKWGFLFAFNARGYAQIIDDVLCKYKYKFFCVQVKNKRCAVNFIRHLIPWRSPHGSETVESHSPIDLVRDS